MVYPIQVARTYVNTDGNVIASGLYRSYLTQEMANNFPQWMALRQSPGSVGQQLMAPSAVALEGIEHDLDYNIRSKFINTAPVDEIDVLYRVKMPSNLNLLDASASGVRCIAAPSGCSPSGVSQIWVKETSSLEDFYYNDIPTRMEIVGEIPYSNYVQGYAWHAKPSGIVDTESKKFDVWKKRHDVSWCYSEGYIRKQDFETMEDYEKYQWNASGVISDMYYSNGILLCIGQVPSGCYISMVSTKTQEPPAQYLDRMAEFDFTMALQPGEVLENILIDASGLIWCNNGSHTKTYNIKPRYDYFIMDKRSRHIYFREDYRDSGVFVSNT